MYRWAKDYFSDTCQCDCGQGTVTRISDTCSRGSITYLLIRHCVAAISSLPAACYQCIVILTGTMIDFTPRILSVSVIFGHKARNSFPMLGCIPMRAQTLRWTCRLSSYEQKLNIFSPNVTGPLNTEIRIS